MAQNKSQSFTERTDTMKTIITPTERTTPRIVYHADLLAVHVSESEVVLYDTGGFSDGPLSEVPTFTNARDLIVLGIIEADEIAEVQRQQGRRQSEAMLRESREYLANLAAKIEKQAAELEAME